MHKRILMLAKIALIIAAAQIHITAANFISAQTNMPSNATYAMSNASKHPTLEAFKEQIEGKLSDPTTNHLSPEDQTNIENTIQDFIDKKESIALALYITNQWDIIKELCWQSDVVYNYVQSCLSGLYNSTHGGPTIHVYNRDHTGNAEAIENLKQQPINNNIQRALLRDIFHPDEKKSNLQTVLDNAEDYDLTNEQEDLSPNERYLIIPTIFFLNIFKPSARGNTNEKTQQLTGLIIQLISQNIMPIHASDLKWIRDNKETITKLIAETGFAIHKLTQLSVQPSFSWQAIKVNIENEECWKSLERARPDILLSNFLAIIHGIKPTEQPSLEGTKMAALEKQLQQNIYNAFLSSDENGANPKSETHNYNTQKQIEQLLNEFLKFIIGREITKQNFNHNRSTIFKEAAAKIQQAAHETNSIQLTQKQKDLLRLIKNAYSHIKRTATEQLRQWDYLKYTYLTKYQTEYKKIYIETYEQILEQVLTEGKIAANQIAKELDKKGTELQQAEDKQLKGQEARDSYAKAFYIIGLMLLNMQRNQVNASKKQVFTKIDWHITQLKNAIANNDINNDKKTIERYLEDLFEAAYKQISDDDKIKKLIKEVILPHLKQQCTNNKSGPKKEQTEFKIKQLLKLIRLIVQAEIGQYTEVSSEKEGPTQMPSPSINWQARGQDDSLLTDYHITKKATHEGKQTEQHIAFNNISLIERNLLSDLLLRTLSNLRHYITSNEIQYLYGNLKNCANAFETTLLILNKEKLDEETNIKTDDLNTKEQIIIKQNKRLCSKLEAYINALPMGTNKDWVDTIQKTNKHIQWIFQRITKEELSRLVQDHLKWIINTTNECITALQGKIHKQKKREQEEEKERLKKEEREELSNPFKDVWEKIKQTKNYCIKKLQETINNQKRENEEERKKKEEEEQKAKAQGSKLSTMQKIINNLSATNKMLQIIMQILY